MTFWITSLKFSVLMIFFIFFCLSDDFFISLSNLLQQCLFMCVDTFAAVVKMFIGFVICFVRSLYGSHGNSGRLREFHFGTVQLSAVRGGIECLF